VRDSWDVGRRAPADVVERDCVEVSVSFEFVGASTPQSLSLVAQQARYEIASCWAQVVHVGNVQRRRPVKHLTTHVINVRSKIKKKRYKNVCKRDKKTLPSFLLAFNVQPTDKITDIN